MPDTDKVPQRNWFLRNVNDPVHKAAHWSWGVISDIAGGVVIGLAAVAIFVGFYIYHNPKAQHKLVSWLFPAVVQQPTAVEPPVTPAATPTPVVIPTPVGTPIAQPTSPQTNGGQDKVDNIDISYDRYAMEQEKNHPFLQTLTALLFIAGVLVLVGRTITPGNQPVRRPLPRPTPEEVTASHALARKEILEEPPIEMPHAQDASDKQSVKKPTFSPSFIVILALIALAIGAAIYFQYIPIN